MRVDTSETHEEVRAATLRPPWSKSPQISALARCGGRVELAWLLPLDVPPQSEIPARYKCLCCQSVKGQERQQMRALETLTRDYDAPAGNER